MRAYALLLLFLPLFAGCGSRDTCYPVGGVVQFRGQPLAGGLVVFTPDADRGNSGPIAYATIQPDGSFELYTEEKPGAARGWYRITVAPPVDDASRLRYRDFPQRFRSPTVSSLAWEVKAIRDKGAKSDAPENRISIEITP